MQTEEGLGPRADSHQQGITLIGLMVVIAMLATLLALAAPSFRDMQKNSAAKTLVANS